MKVSKSTVSVTRERGGVSTTSTSSTTSVKSFRTSNFGTALRAVGLLVSILLLVSTFRILNNSSPVTFTSILDFLGNYNSPISIEWGVTAWQMTEEWTILDGLRRFLNVIGEIAGFAVFMVANLVNLISFVSDFIVFIVIG